MIDKNVNYNDKDFSKHLKGLGLSKEEIKYILNETKRKKFEDGGDGGSGGDGSSGDGSSGDGSSGEGDSSAGDSGPGGSDDGSGHGGPGGQGDSGPGGSDDGTGHGGPGSGLGGAESGFGIGPNAEAEAAESAAANTGVTGAVNAVTGFAKNTIANAIDNPVQTALGIANPALGFAFGLAKDAYSNYSRGVTGPSDDTQESTSVQSGPSQSPSGGGISTIAEYAPTYNPNTGNPTMDAYVRRLRVNLGLPV
jgi:hypothetical protein